jgi:hypothetical protein
MLDFMRRPFQFVFLALAGAAVASCSTGDVTEERAAGADHPVTCAGLCSKDMYIVAHQDDDLLFMNPDLQNSIAAGHSVRTVYITAGDATAAGQPLDTEHVHDREVGIKAAYFQMANVPSAFWSYAPMTVDGRQVHRQNLVGTNISVVFLRLPNQYDTAPNTKLAKLYTGAVPSLTTIDTDPSSDPPPSSYSRTNLFNVLTGLIDAFGPDRIATLDCSDLHLGAPTPDHYDHRYAAKFAFEANRRSASFGSRNLSSYIGYPAVDWVTNLSQTEFDSKWSVFSTYGCHDGALSACAGGCAPCDPNSGDAGRARRQYATGALPSAGGTSRKPISAVGKCLDIAGGASANGTNVQVWDCADVAARRWKVLGGKISALVGGLEKCLDVSGGSSTTVEVADGTNVQIWDCANVLAQKWTVLSNGQIRGPWGKCLDVDGGNSGSVPNGRNVQLWSCGPGTAQKWTVQYGPTSKWSQGTDFSDTYLDSSVSYYGSVRLADVTGDRIDDACARRDDGVWCAVGSATSFGSWTRWTTEFSNAHGWLPADHGSTLMLADIDGDLRADICGRGNSGIVCAFSTGSTFGVSSLKTSAFANGGGWDTNVSQYGSLRIADVTGDGLADICGRATSGIQCALNNGVGLFGSAQAWLTTEFTDALGWSAEKYGTTIQLGDINWDNKADVCGRGSAGIHCALSNGVTGFVKKHQWSAEFSDALGWGASSSVYRSIRLVDINNDHFADICGRTSTGIVCAYSNGGSSFDTSLPLMPREYLDTTWLPEKYGMTLQFRSNGDVCGRNSTGLICAQSP